ncbi:MAG TPA: ribosome biogenesis GTP-binding protein YihA/YsxC [Planctomycetota bacterium]|nr:ribosome biogenesis GTP-binding protein YihA/YsxC [Planctomycetota bacterium]
MSRALQLEFLATASEVGQLPASRAEVAFIGRSNVGKSSLLNALAGGKPVARTSNTPGRTQSLDCFALERSGATVVDCPGYGYAKVSKRVRGTWLPMLEGYLLGREQLVMVLLLVDGEIGPTASDLHMLQWLREHDVPHCVVATKHDKVKSSKRLHRQKEFAERCDLQPTDVVWVSATEQTGITQLRELVREWLA